MNDLITVAKNIIQNQGIKPYQTKLSQTHCVIKKTRKKFGPFKYYKKDYEITEDFAKQIITINKLHKFESIIIANYKKIESENSEKAKDYKSLLKTVYSSLYIYNNQLDTPDMEDNYKNIALICNQKIKEHTSKDYSVKYDFSDLKSDEKTFIKLINIYNKNIINNSIKQNLSEQENEK